MIEYKNLGKELTGYATRSGKEISSVFSDFLAFGCDMLDWREHGSMPGSMVAAQERDPFFFDCFMAWAEESYRHNRLGEFTDLLGPVYESIFLLKSKAASTGQFFTPMSVTGLIASLVGCDRQVPDGVVMHSDPAVGSGRTLLSLWQECDKYAKNYFEGQDIDNTSVMMTALNMAVNGMVGTVERMDSLSREWTSAYIVNACKVPFANDYTLIEKFTERPLFEARRARMLELMEQWNVGNYRR